MIVHAFTLLALLCRLLQKYPHLHQLSHLPEIWWTVPKAYQDLPADGPLPWISDNYCHVYSRYTVFCTNLKKQGSLIQLDPATASQSFCSETDPFFADYFVVSPVEWNFDNQMVLGDAMRDAYKNDPDAFEELWHKKGSWHDCDFALHQILQACLCGTLRICDGFNWFVLLPIKNANDMSSFV